MKPSSYYNSLASVLRRITLFKIAKKITTMVFNLILLNKNIVVIFLIRDNLNEHYVRLPNIIIAIWKTTPNELKAM